MMIANQIHAAKTVSAQAIFTITNPIIGGASHLLVLGVADRHRAGNGIPGGGNANGVKVLFGRTPGLKMDAMAELILYLRFARSRMEEALEVTPVVLIHRPRHCGKSTLARMVGDAAGYEYITFDDDVQLALAHKQDAIGDLVKNGFEKHQKSRRLFDQAKTRVERLIEEAVQS